MNWSVKETLKFNDKYFQSGDYVDIIFKGYWRKQIKGRITVINKSPIFSEDSTMKLDISKPFKSEIIDVPIKYISSIIKINKDEEIGGR